MRPVKFSNSALPTWLGPTEVHAAVRVELRGSASIATCCLFAASRDAAAEVRWASVRPLIKRALRACLAVAGASGDPCAREAEASASQAQSTARRYEDGSRHNCFRGMGLLPNGNSGRKP